MSWYSFVQKYFGILFTAGLLSGLFFPGIFMPITNYVMLILAAVMVLIFLTIDYKAVLHNLRNFHSVGISVLFLKLLLPFLLYIVAKPFGETISIAVLLLTLTPIAAVAPTLTKLTGGDTEFIIICQCLTTLLAPFYMPARSFFYLPEKK